MWIDANAPYHDRFVNKRPQQPAYDLAADSELHRVITGVHEHRCASCHEAEAVSHLSWIDLRAPEHSLFLADALVREAGGTARCDGAVYRRRSDPDYQAVLRSVQAAVRRAWKHPRRDLEGITTAKAGVAR